MKLSKIDWNQETGIEAIDVLIFVLCCFVVIPWLLTAGAASLSRRYWIAYVVACVALTVAGGLIFLSIATVIRNHHLFPELTKANGRARAGKGF